MQSDSSHCKNKGDRIDVFLHQKDVSYLLTELQSLVYILYAADRFHTHYLSSGIQPYTCRCFLSFYSSGQEPESSCLNKKNGNKF